MGTTPEANSTVLVLAARYPSWLMASKEYASATTAMSMPAFSSSTTRSTAS